MQAMAMTPEERAWLTRIEQKVDVNEQRIENLEKKINSILTLVRGIAIGLAIGALFFGLIKGEDIIKIFTK